MSLDNIELSPRTPRPQSLSEQQQGPMATPANPAGTTSTVGVHAGLAISFTPKKTGRILIEVTVNGANNTAGDGAASQIRQGTGTAPANGAALAGTPFGTLGQNISAAINNINELGMIAIISGLVVGMPIWIDLSEAAVTGGTATLTSITVIIIEL